MFNHIPKIENKIVEKEIEVMGDVIEIPKPYLVENRVVVPRFIDSHIPTVVTQTITPHFIESEEHIVEVRLKEYEPEIIAVDIFLPRPVDRSVVIPGETTRSHTPIDIPLAHYNSLVLKLNSSPELTEETSSIDPTGHEETSPLFWRDHMLVPTANGAVPVLKDKVEVIAPKSNDWENEYDPNADYIIRSSDQNDNREEKKTSHM